MIAGNIRTLGFNHENYEIFAPPPKLTRYTVQKALHGYI